MGLGTIFKQGSRMGEI